MLSSGHRASGPDEVAVERLLSNGKRMYVHGFKLALVRRCLEPGVSVAAVALEHGINANLLRKWIDKHKAETMTSSGPTLLPVTIEASISEPAPQVGAHSSEAVQRRDSSSCIELEMFGARLTLRGEVNARQLRLVLDAIARHR